MSPSPLSLRYPQPADYDGGWLNETDSQIARRRGLAQTRLQTAGVFTSFVILKLGPQDELSLVYTSAPETKTKTPIVPFSYPTPDRTFFSAFTYDFPSRPLPWTFHQPLAAC